MYNAHFLYSEGFDSGTSSGHFYSFYSLGSAYPSLVSAIMALNMGFPNPRRIVTGHNDAGEAIVVADSEIEPAPILGVCNFAVLWETHNFPTTDNNEFDDPIKKTTESLSNENGVVLRVVDFPAKTKTVSRNILE
jgi:hypothetical protein